MRPGCTDSRCPGRGGYWWGYHNCACVPPVDRIREECKAARGHNLTKRVLVAALVIFAIAGCGSPPESGYVIGREYDDPDRWTTHDPVYRTSCTPVTRTRQVYDSNTGSYRTEIYTDQDCQQVIAYYETNHHYDGPHWKLKIRDDKDKDHTGWVEVSESEYSDFLAGTHWPDPR